MVNIERRIGSGNVHPFCTQSLQRVHSFRKVIENVLDELITQCGPELNVGSMHEGKAKMKVRMVRESLRDNLDQVKKKKKKQSSSEKLKNFTSESSAGIFLGFHPSYSLTKEL